MVGHQVFMFRPWVFIEVVADAYAENKVKKDCIYKFRDMEAKKRGLVLMRRERKGRGEVKEAKEEEKKKAKKEEKKEKKEVKKTEVKKARTTQKEEPAVGAKRKGSQEPPPPVIKRPAECKARQEEVRGGGCNDCDSEVSSMSDLPEMGLWSEAEILL